MRARLRIAWRSIWRNRRRTLISMAAVGIGLTLVILYDGLILGILGDAKRQLDNTGMGHVEIYATGWRAQHKPSANIPAPAAVLRRLAVPAGADVGARVVARGLATTARGNEGVQILGVDWNAESTLAAHLQAVREGAWPATDDARGLLLGDSLAERLKVKVGSKVRLMVQRADGEMGADLFRVRGIYHALSDKISGRLVYVSTTAAQSLVGIGDAGHTIVIQLSDPGQADALATRLAAELGTDFEVKSYSELMPMLKTMEDLTGTMLVVMALFVYLLVGLGIFNTILMSVHERTREFGVMLATGTRPAQLVAQVLAESFWIATLSVAIGLALGLAITWYGSENTLFDMSSVGESIDFGGAMMKTAFRSQCSPREALKAAGLVYLMALVVGLFPAWRVSRLQPAVALRAK